MAMRKELSWGWRKVALWTTLAPLACTLVSVAAASLAFAEFDDAVRLRAAWVTTLVPLGLGVPLFLYFSLKMRELAAANRRLGRIAATDGLTRFLNRSAFTTIVETRLESLLPTGSPIRGAMLIADIDHFKQINDRFGHHNGDIALTLIAEAIRASIRSGDTAGRLGGEEFGVFLPGVARPAAETVAERLRRAVERIVFVADGQLHPLTISVGGVVFDRPAAFTALYQQADERLYAAKRAGRNRVALTSLAESAPPLSDAPA